MNTIWLYWEDRPGDSIPAHIALCRKVLEYQCRQCDVRLVTPGNVRRYLPDLDERVWDISLAQKSQNPIAVRCAFIRAWLLERYGGLYVDSDCVALKDFAGAFDEAQGSDFFAMRRTSAKTNHISIGFYGSREKGDVVGEYAEELRRILATKQMFSWGEVGAHLLTPIVDAHLEEVYLFREDRIHPVVAEKQDHFCSVWVSARDVVPDDALCFMLFHRIFEQDVRGVSLKEATPRGLYHGQTLLGEVLRSAYPRAAFEQACAD